MACNALLFAKADQAAHYSLHRPTYPRQLYEAILSHTPKGRALAVDIATGSGQAAGALAEFFDKVIAQDASPAQLQHADRRHANVEYQHATAHDTGLPSGCADLVTVAQALHWFDTPELPITQFYQEVCRVLHPTGCFAAWTYGLPTLVHKDHPANAALLHLYDAVLGAYWADGRRHVETAYAEIAPAAGREFRAVERLSFDAPKTACVDDVVGLVQSWSAYHTFLEQHPQQEDPVLGFKQDLLRALAAQDGSYELPVIHTITLVVAKEPIGPVSSTASLPGPA